MKGAIIGDIVGSIYEWHNIKTKDFPLFAPNCFFTDDSIMTLAVGRAFLNCTDVADFPEELVYQMRLFGADELVDTFMTHLNGIYGVSATYDEAIL